MKNNTYRSVEIQKVTAAQVLALIVTPVVLFALDVAKRRVLLAITDAAGGLARLAHFAMPDQLSQVLALAAQIVADGRSVQFVLEPTGTYGDPIVAQAHRAGHEVFLVSPKRTHDAAEVFDGVPSKHDPKDATIIARLHAQGIATRWKPMPMRRRELRALIAERELYAAPLQEHLGRAEAWLASWWPELLQAVEVHTRISLHRWLLRYPDPALVRADPTGAAQALRAESRGRFDKDAIERVVQSAVRSQAEAMSEPERRLMQVTFEEIVRLHERLDGVDARITATIDGEPAYATMRKMLGAPTVAVLVAAAGDPSSYASAQALEKAYGLNLKERSSGGRQNAGVHVTKRGPGLVRSYLYMTAMRLVGSDPVVRAWYQRRGAFRAGDKVAALVAVMRKLVRAIWCVSKGAPFDATKLFDVRRLGVVSTAATHEGGAAITKAVVASVGGGVSPTK